MANRLYGSRLHGAALGVLSALAGLAAAELVAGLVRDAASPVVSVGQEVIDAVPPAVKDWAIDTFGTADKPVLVAGTIVVVLVIGSLVGILAVRGRMAAAYALTAAVGTVGLLAVWSRPDPGLAKSLPAIVGTVASIGVLWWLAPLADVETAEGVDGAAAAGGEPRRALLRGAVVVTAAAVAAGAFGRLLRRRFDVDDERAAIELPPPGDSPSGGTAQPSGPAGSDFGIDGVVPFVVPNADFYRIDTALQVPQVPKDTWRLKVHGMVDRELELTFADLLDRDTIERYVTLSCVSNQVGGDLVGNALWQGVRLSEILDEAGVHDDATQVVSTSRDGWTCGTPTSAIMDGRDAMLAFAMNGEPLPPEHGYPVRMVVPGLYGYVSATKWVTSIELMRWDDFDAYWVPRGWAKEGPVKTMARIDRPSSGKKMPADRGGGLVIGGIAWAVHRGISKVEVSFDDADEWYECELAGVPSDDTWRQFRYHWADPGVGDHSVRARGYDGAGDPQPEEPKSVAPDGAQGYHRVTFTYEG